MSTCNCLDLETVGSRPIMLKNLHGCWRSLHLDLLEVARVLEEAHAISCPHLFSLQVHVKLACGHSHPSHTLVGGLHVNTSNSLFFSLFYRIQWVQSALAGCPRLQGPPNWIDWLGGHVVPLVWLGYQSSCHVVVQDLSGAEYGSQLLIIVTRVSFFVSRLPAIFQCE